MGPGAPGRFTQIHRSGGDWEKGREDRPGFNLATVIFQVELVGAFTLCMSTLGRILYGEVYTHTHTQSMGILPISTAEHTCPLTHASLLHLLSHTAKTWTHTRVHTTDILHTGLLNLHPSRAGAHTCGW